MNFERALAFGKIAENKIIRWLEARGAINLPIYELETEQHFKGPRAYTHSAQYRGPDVLVGLPKKGPHFVEAKAKTCFSWYRKNQTWQTGIDYACYRDYLAIRELFELPLWLLFLHEASLPDARDLRQGSPPLCPTGLFGGEIRDLAKSYDHTVGPSWKNNSRSGMVYWADTSLIRIASVEEMNRTIQEAGDGSR